MTKKQNTIVSILEMLTYIILALCFIAGTFLHWYTNQGVFIIMFGMVFLSFGGFGYLKKELPTTKGGPLKYKDDSIVGKAINIVYCLAGLIIICFGILVLLGVC